MTKQQQAAALAFAARAAHDDGNLAEAARLYREAAAASPKNAARFIARNNGAAERIEKGLALTAQAKAHANHSRLMAKV